MNWRRIPKAELHVHLEGTLSLADARRMGRRNGLEVEGLPALPPGGVASFAEFIGPYRAYAAMLRTEEDFAEAALAHLQRSRPWGIEHVEFAIDAGEHAVRGVRLETITAGVDAALATVQVSGGVIVTLDRSASVAHAEEMVAMAIRCQPSVIGVGIAGAELESADARFRHVFAAAAAAGLMVTVHAGRLDVVREAVDDPSVRRIDHGFRVLEDPGLVRAARDRDLHFALAPKTNVLIGPISALSEHPLPAMVAAGLSVSLSSDDPAFLTPFDEVIEEVVESLGIDARTLAALFQASIANSAHPRRLPV